MKKIICLSILLCFTEISYADILKLKDQRVFHGTFIESDEDAAKGVVKMKLLGLEKIITMNTADVESKEYVNLLKDEARDLCSIPQNVETCKINASNYMHNKQLYERFLIEEDESICEEIRGDSNIKRICYDLVKLRFAVKNKDESICSKLSSEPGQFFCSDTVKAYILDPSMDISASYEETPVLWGRKKLPVPTLNR